MNSELVKIRREKWLRSQGLMASPRDEETNHNQNHEQDHVANQKSAAKVLTSFIDLTNSSDEDNVPIELSKKNTVATNSRKRKVDDASSPADFMINANKLRNLPKFSVCTYNVWFGNAHPQVRMNKIAQTISDQTPRPTFIGLQEVTPYLLQELSPLLKALGYGRILYQENVAYGCALFILTEDSPNTSSATVIQSGFEPFTNTCMSRGLLWIHAKLKFTNIHVLFTTTHLESYINAENDGSKAREMQVIEAVQFCTGWMSNQRKNDDSFSTMILTGDLNWDDERKRSTGSDRNLLSIVNGDHGSEDNTWVDSWKECRSIDGYTYDSKENPMLKGNLRRRFDRCLICSSSNEVSISSAEIVGKEVIPGYLYRKEVPEWKFGKPTGNVTYQDRPLCASDHFGLVVNLNV